MALDSNGLDIPRLQEIKDQLATDLQTELGIPIDTSEQATAGIINSIYSAALANAYEIIQASYDQRKLFVAEGVNLDDLVGYLGLTRLGALQTVVPTVHFTGTEGTNIPQNSEVSNPSTGEIFLVENTFTIQSVNAFNVTLSVNQVLNDTAYVITINGSEFTYTSDADATQDEILTGIETAFAGSAGYTVTKVGELLEIESLFNNVSINVVTSTFFTKEEVTSISSLVAEDTGTVQAPIGSITKIETPIAGFFRVTNPVKGIVGRDRETDDELRARQQENLSNRAVGTVQAIKSNISEIDLVTSVEVVENDTNFVDLSFRPPKSFEAIVVGGLDEDVAEVIFASKPAGIETFGNITQAILDSEGISRSVNFSRPRDIYIHVEISYTLYDEESFPVDGEDLIKQAVLDKASELGANNDVIPKRFYGAIYTNVEGIEDLVVTMAKTFNPGDVPVAYSDDAIDIDAREIPNFDLARIAIV